MFRTELETNTTMESSLQDEKFFEQHLPEDTSSSYAAFLAHVDINEDACAKTIHGKPPTIAVSQVWFGNAPWLASNTPSHRPAPSLVHHHAFTRPGAIKIALTQPLQVGWGKWAQVWKGEMTLASAPDVPPAPVCIKIFQESLYTRPADFDPEHGLSGEWNCGAQHARKEAWAYSAMSSIQGTWPVCFCRSSKNVLPAIG
jgi:hypothetical protein